MAASTPIPTLSPTGPLANEPPHILTLLQNLHALSLAQEAPLTASDYHPSTIHDTMRDKFIALEPDKCAFLYTLARSINATSVVEAGTSFGVSTIYLALAAGRNARESGKRARVVGTEHEGTKAERARGYWGECGDSVTGVVDLRVGDLRETLKSGLEGEGSVDLLLLDIWGPMILPALKLVEPHFRHGAVIISDNTIGSAEAYQPFFEYIRRPGSGYITNTLPFHKGLEMSVYLPGKREA